MYEKQTAVLIHAPNFFYLSARFTSPQNNAKPRDNKVRLFLRGAKLLYSLQEVPAKFGLFCCAQRTNKILGGTELLTYEKSRTEPCINVCSYHENSIGYRRRQFESGASR